LARQHYKSFAERFRGFPLEVASCPRFVSAKRARTPRAMASTRARWMWSLALIALLAEKRFKSRTVGLADQSTKSNQLLALVTKSA